MPGWGARCCRGVQGTRLYASSGDSSPVFAPRQGRRASGGDNSSGGGSVRGKTSYDHRTRGRLHVHTKSRNAVRRGGGRRAAWPVRPAAAGGGGVRASYLRRGLPAGVLDFGQKRVGVCHRALAAAANERGKPALGRQQARDTGSRLERRGWG